MNISLYQIRDRKVILLKVQMYIRFNFFIIWIFEIGTLVIDISNAIPLHQLRISKYILHFHLFQNQNKWLQNENRQPKNYLFLQKDRILNHSLILKLNQPSRRPNHEPERLDLDKFDQVIHSFLQNFYLFSSFWLSNYNLLYISDLQ